MLSSGSARKVIVHLNEDTSSNTGFAYDQIFRFLYDKGVAGATLSRLDSGFGSHHQTHNRQSAGAAKLHLPVQIEFIESPEHVEALLPELCDLVVDGLVEVQETRIVKAVKQEISF